MGILYYCIIISADTIGMKDLWVDFIRMAGGT